MRALLTRLKKFASDALHRSGVNADTAVYGLSAVGAVAGFALETMDVGEGSGVILTLASLFVAGIRMVLKKIDASPGDDGLPTGRAGLAPFAQILWDEEMKRARTRLRGIAEGMVVVRNPDRLGKCLQLMTQKASGEMWAVDFVPLETWFSAPSWTDYHKIQMQACHDRSIDLVRIRIVSKEELNDRHQCMLLSTFIDRHEEAGATILLCPEGALDGVDNVWTFRSDGCLLAEIDAFPACIIGPNVYLKDSTVVQTCRADFRTLKKYVLEKGLHDEVLKQLNQALAEDFDEDAPENL